MATAGSAQLRVPLLERLCDAGYERHWKPVVRWISPQWMCVGRVVDLKTPGSAEVGRNRYENIAHLTRNDQVKFVICSREDYDWAVSKLIEFGLGAGPVRSCFSPSHGQVDVRALADWIVADEICRCDCSCLNHLERCAWPLHGAHESF